MRNRQRLEALANLATEVFGSDDLEIDPLKSSKEISQGGDGIWVRAWVHIDNARLEKAGITNPMAN